MVPTTIVVPLDGSEFAERALPVARALAERLGSGLLLVTTRSDHDPEPPEDYLARVVESTPGLPTRTLVIHEGPTAAAIALVAREHPGRVVCMTTHGRGGLRWAVLGSVAEEVVRQSSDPVVLVGRRCWTSWPTAPAGLVVCTDGSATSREIVPHACEWAKALGLEVRIAEVTHPLDVESATHPGAVLQPLVDQARTEGVTAHAVLLRSSYPAGALVDYAESLPASMLAMSSHGRTGLARVAFGSVTMGVLNTAPCPVLVTRAANLR